MAVHEFPRPSGVPIPLGAEDWASPFPYYSLFGGGRLEQDEKRFWFRDSLHHPEPLFPFDAITAESWWVGLGQANTRIFVFPTSLGLDQRILNGYLYVSANPVTDPQEVSGRLKLFKERSGFYYDNWDDLYARWIDKTRALIDKLSAVNVPDLPPVESLGNVTAGRGISSAFDLVESYNRVIESMFMAWQYHFEMLNLGYAAYLSFFELCKRHFPSIPDQNIARMVSGIDVLLFRPEEELKRLATAAVELGVDPVLAEERDAAGAFDALRQSEPGREWLARFENAREPWFNISTGTGFTHLDRSWNDELDVPIASIRAYIARLHSGESLRRPLEALQAERERLRAFYEPLLPTDDHRKAFRDQLALARRVFPYIENHNFYIEHWHHSIFWNKMRRFGRLLAANRFFEREDDIFYLNRYEVAQALYDLCTSWASGTPARGPTHWPQEVRRRAEVRELLAANPPPRVLGQRPAAITDPITIMLWGITTERIDAWARSAAAEAGTGATSEETDGFPASPGVVEGHARIVTEPGDLRSLRSGEILVCSTIPAGWTAAFASAAGVVTDIGGMMSHAAIVCREYGLPAVTGTGHATSLFRTGQHLHVDGGRGRVSVVD